MFDITSTLARRRGRLAIITPLPDQVERLRHSEREDVENHTGPPTSRPPARPDAAPAASRFADPMHGEQHVTGCGQASDVVALVCGQIVQALDEQPMLRDSDVRRHRNGRPRASPAALVENAIRAAARSRSRCTRRSSVMLGLISPVVGRHPGPGTATDTAQGVSNASGRAHHRRRGERHSGQTGRHRRVQRLIIPVLGPANHRKRDTPDPICTRGIRGYPLIHQRRDSRPRVSATADPEARYGWYSRPAGDGACSSLDRGGRTSEPAGRTCRRPAALSNESWTPSARRKPLRSRRVFAIGESARNPAAPTSNASSVAAWSAAMPAQRWPTPAVCRWP